MRTVQATRYVTALREGGSMPGLVEADDDGLYVLKFRGAGQGAKALVAELIAGELARAAGLPVPEIVFVALDPELGRAEPDPEIQDLIAASAGLNVGLDYLPGSLTYNPAAGAGPDPGLAAEIVWLDALVTNVDRSPQNRAARPATRSRRARAGARPGPGRLVRTTGACRLPRVPATPAGEPTRVCGRGRGGPQCRLARSSTRSSGSSRRSSAVSA